MYLLVACMQNVKTQKNIIILLQMHAKFSNEIIS